jgi:hypothetical protein
VTRHRLHVEARAPAEPLPADATRVMTRPPIPPAGPPVLLCAIRQAAEDGTGPDAAARLAAVLVLIDLELTVLADSGQLPLIAEADAELRAARCTRCGVPRHRHTAAVEGDDTTHEWRWTIDRRTIIGRFRRQAAALLCGRGPAPTLPGAERIPVADLYEQAAADPQAWWRSAARK